MIHEKKHDVKVLLACMPKSGSTFLSGAIAQLPGFVRAHLVPGYGHREQELGIEQLREYDRLLDNGAYGGYVAQHHVRYSGCTQQYLQEFGLRPVVLVRNIFDIVVSLIDHHSLESIEYPAAFAPANIASRTFDDQARFVTHMAIPWYINFFVSWNECPAKFLLTYEDFISEPNATLAAICRHLSVDASEQVIHDAVRISGTAGVRKNKMSPGRGKLLPADCIEAIRQMASFYPGVDFQSIGIV